MKHTFLACFPLLPSFLLLMLPFLHSCCNRTGYEKENENKMESAAFFHSLAKQSMQGILGSQRNFTLSFTGLIQQTQVHVVQSVMSKYMQF